MKNAFLLPLLIVLAITSSCSKSPGKTSSKIQIISGNFAALLTNKANNGLFFYGRSNDGKVFTKKVDTDTIDLVFPNGTWNFFAISYELGVAPAAGSLPNFTGKTYCGKTTANLNGTDASIQINLTNDGCNDPAFSNNVKFMSEYRFPQFDFFNCKNIGGVLSPTSCDQNPGAKFNKGYATSYKIVAYEAKNFGDPTAPVKIAESSCFRSDFSNLTGLTDAADTTPLQDLHLPTNIGAGFNLVLQVYYASGAFKSNTGCDPSLGVDNLPLAENPRMKFVIDTAPSSAAIYKTFIKTDEADVCQGPRMGAGAFAAGFGTAGSPYAVCTKDQLNLLRTNFTSFKEASFDLLTDIDYGNQKIAPIGDPLTDAGLASQTNFYGRISLTNKPVFNGRGHKISNYMMDCKTPAGTNPNEAVGFFRYVKEAEIKNLTINNGIIMCDNGDIQGGLIGDLWPGTGGSIIENIRFHGHVEGKSNIGGLIGRIQDGTVTINNVHVKGEYGGQQFYGGLVGCMNPASSSSINRSSFVGSIHSKGGGGTPVESDAGGLVGYAFTPSPSQRISISETVVKLGRLEGSTMVGGIIGHSVNVDLSDSYVTGLIVASGTTDGTSSKTQLGGIVGYDDGGNYTRVLAVNIFRRSNKGSSDTTSGPVIGDGVSAPVCNSVYYTGDPGGQTCGSALTLASAKIQSNYTGLAIKMPVLTGSWDAAALPAAYTSSFPNCTTAEQGRYYDITSGNISTSAFGAVLPGDIILCNGSSNVLVQLMNRDTVLTSAPYIWSMPDDSYDIPRLAFESLIENKVPALKRECHGHYTTQFGSGTESDPKWICSLSQFNNMATDTSKFYALKKDIVFDGTIGTYNPLVAGAYKLNGNNYSLINFSMNIPGTTITSDLNVGIFSGLDAGASINNLNIMNAGINAPNVLTSSGLIIRVGLLSGYNLGSVNKINVYEGKLYINATAGTGDVFHIGGVVGKNSGTIFRSKFDSPLRIEGDFSNASMLAAGGLVGQNTAMVEGIEGHASVSRGLNCSTSFANLYNAPTEDIGGIAGQNISGATIKEVRVEGEVRGEIYTTNAQTGCYAHFVGHVTPFVGGNAGVIQDFTVRPRINLANTTSPILEILGVNTGTVQRGIVEIETMDANKIMNQVHTQGSDWDALNAGGAFSASTPTCDPTLAGSYYNIISSAVSTPLGDVANGDIVMCNGSVNMVIPSALKGHVLLANSMSQVLYSVEKPATTPPILAAGRTFDKDLRFYPGTSSGLKAGNANGDVFFDNAPWSVSQNFFAPGTAAWFMMIPQGGAYANKLEVVKASGGPEDLGPPFVN